jgi:NADH dehydrogenase (ubiquinone) 1 beta subcomplex subunit 9
VRIGVGFLLPHTYYCIGSISVRSGKSSGIPVSGHLTASGDQRTSVGRMGSAASMHAARAAAWEEGITHAQRVTRLYRASLRTSRDWIVDYELWLVDAARIQARFRSNKGTSIVEGRDLVEKGMAELFERRHPEPYIPNYMEGASKYQRNVPPPPEVRELHLRSRLFSKTRSIFHLCFVAVH